MAETDPIAKQAISALAKQLPVNARPTKAEIDARIERDRQDADHKRQQESQDNAHKRRQENVLLSASLWFGSASGIVCVAAIFSPWSTPEVQRWATTLLTAIVTSVVSFKAGKGSSA